MIFWEYINTLLLFAKRFLLILLNKVLFGINI